MWVAIILWGIIKAMKMMGKQVRDAELIIFNAQAYQLVKSISYSTPV